MSNKRTRLEFWLDLIIPVAAVFVICFSLGSLFYAGHSRIGSTRFARSHKSIYSERRGTPALLNCLRRTGRRICVAEYHPLSVSLPLRRLCAPARSHTRA